MKRKSKSIKIFLAIIILSLSCVCSMAVYGAPGEIDFDQIEQYSTELFDLRGKTFSGMYGSRSCSLEFYSEEYNSTQNTCLKLIDGTNTSYIYFNYDSLWNSDTNTLNAYTSAVLGYLSSYAPLSVKCQWINDKLTVNITLTNGMSVCNGSYPLTSSKPDPAVPQPDPGENESAVLTLEQVYGVVGKKEYLQGTYVPKKAENIQSELESIIWEIGDSTIGEIGKFSYIISSDNKRATLNLEVEGKKYGETTITGNISRIGGDNVSVALVIEPELIIPKSNGTFVDNYDSDVVINGEDYICIKVKLNNSDVSYLEDFLKKIKVEIEKESSSLVNAVADISNQGYVVSDDGTEGEYIIPIGPGLENIDNILTISTVAQEKTIRVIYNSPWEDADKDGIPDKWEEEGVDIDKDGVIDLDLKAMGAVVGHKDIFVEIDIMDGIKQISQTSLDMVAKQFMDHGFYLHIDAGANSIDYVTGKKWGNLTKSDTLPYAKLTELSEQSNYNKWDILTETYFSNDRRAVFRHCMLINAFDENGTSGIARGIPEQSFVITMSGYGNENNNSTRAMAGTFMHELGHTLGLQHGGTDHTRYKPNDLSIMNYLYQFSGLYGTNEVNYSEYELPELNENAIDERKGIDPDGVITNPNLGAKWLFKEDRLNMDSIFYPYHESNVSGKAIDFNRDGKIDALLQLDFWHGGDELSEPQNGINTKSINEWEALIFKAGSIGDLGSTSPIAKIITNSDSVVKEDISVEKAIEMGIYENVYDNSHTHVLALINEKKATCTVDGNLEYYECEICGKVFKDINGDDETNKSDIVIKATGHNWGNWTIIKSPSCIDKGSKKRVCSICGYTETSDIDENGHIWEDQYTVDKEPTCTEEGSESIHCKNCDAVKDSKVIPAVGHIWDDGKIISKPSGSEPGEKIYTCKECGNVKKESIPIISNGKDNDSNSNKSVSTKVSEEKTVVETGDDIIIDIWIILAALCMTVIISIGFLKYKK